MKEIGDSTVDVVHVRMFSEWMNGMITLIELVVLIILVIIIRVCEV